MFAGIQHYLNSNPDWLETIFLTVVLTIATIWGAAIGLGLIAIVLANIVNSVTGQMVGFVRFEISTPHLMAGTSCQYLVELSGLFPVRDMQLKLKCTESATYRAG